MARQTVHNAQMTRQRILDAALLVFCQHGVSASTVAHIARRARVTRGAVYGHFKDKQAVLAELIETTSFPTEELAPGRSLADSFGRLTSALLETANCQHTRKILRLILWKVEWTGTQPCVKRRVVQGRRQMMGYLQVVLERSFARAELRKEIRRSDIPLIADALRGAITGLLFELAQTRHSAADALKIRAVMRIHFEAYALAGAGALGFGGP